MNGEDRDDSIRSWLEQELRRIGEDLAAGLDISPARRFRLEGAIQCWARQQRMDSSQLSSQLQHWLMNSDVQIQVEGHDVCLCLPMRRAPVRPTTSD